MMPYESYVNLIRQLDDLVAIFEQHPDPVTQEQVAALLSGLDLLHREGLTRLVGALRDAGADEFLQRAAADPVVEILLGLYDLVELDLPETPQPEPPSPTTFIPLGDITLPQEPRATWVEVARVEELPLESLYAMEVDDIRLLLMNVGGEVYAYRNLCPRCELPIQLARLEGNELLCPWHGCRYDARTGRPLDEGGSRLEVFPVAVRGSSIQLARQQRQAGNTAGAPSRNGARGE